MIIKFNTFVLNTDKVQCAYMENNGEHKPSSTIIIVFESGYILKVGHESIEEANNMLNKIISEANKP